MATKDESTARYEEDYKNRIALFSISKDGAVWCFLLFFGLIILYSIYFASRECLSKWISGVSSFIPVAFVYVLSLDFLRGFLKRGWYWALNKFKSKFEAEIREKIYKEDVESWEKRRKEASLAGKTFHEPPPRKPDKQ